MLLRALLLPTFSPPKALIFLLSFYYYYFHPCIIKGGRANRAISPYHILNKSVLLSQNSRNLDYFVNYALQCFVVVEDFRTFSTIFLSLKSKSANLLTFRMLFFHLYQ